MKFYGKLLRTAAKMSLRRPSPAVIPISDPSKVLLRNYFTFHLTDSQGSLVFWGRTIVPHGIEGKWYDRESQESYDCTVSNSCLDQFGISVTFYLQEIEIKYTSAIEFLFHYFMWVPPRYFLMRERFFKTIYNRRKLARVQRMAVLRYFFGQTISQSNFKASAFDFLTDEFGPRWVNHPDADNLSSYYKLLFNSLVGSQDLIADQSKYYFSLAPKAVATIALQEEEDRRHLDAVRQQKILSLLTFALVLVGIAQVAATFFGTITTTGR